MKMTFEKACNVNRRTWKEFKKATFLLKWGEGDDWRLCTVEAYYHGDKAQRTRQLGLSPEQSSTVGCAIPRKL